jgi:peptidoglycan/xylan/chitin deacetylase (PgdA/CDA1 family)
MPTETCVNICFHGIGTPARELEPGEARYWVTEKAYLDVLDEVAGWGPVRVSFDDGNASDVEQGLPALVERGLTATFFVLAGRLDGRGSLGRDDIRALLDAGMSVGTHGMHHVPWRGLPAAERDTELVTARDRIAEVIGRPVTEAACPLGRYDRRLLADLRRLGYARVHTSDRMTAKAAAVVQPRFSIRADDTVEGLRAEVRRSARFGPGTVLAAKELLKRLR